MSLRREDIERLLAPEFVVGVAAAPVSEVRARRDECQRAEVALSYLRRVLQGELDLVLAELEQRSAGHGGDLGRLVDELPAILSPSPGTSTRDMPLITLPTVADAWLQNRDLVLEDVVADALHSELLESTLPGGTLPGANVGTFTDDELRDVVEGLRTGESDLSKLRRAMHERIDELQAAIVERYKTGAADVDSLLR